MPNSTVTSKLRSLAISLVAIGFVTAFRPTAQLLAARWQEPGHSHGWLIPVLAAGLAWKLCHDAPRRFRDAERRENSSTTRQNSAAVRTGLPTHAGSALLCLALVLQTLGLVWAYDSVAGLAVIPAASGVCLLFGGWRLRWKLWPAVLFLGFVVPLPDFLVAGASQALQLWAANLAAMTLQLIGIPAVADGALLTLPSATLGVSETCSGLRMAMVLGALITAISLASSRSWPLRAALVASALPIAVASNVARIAATACYVHLSGSTEGLAKIHDVAGWLMIPFAALLVAIEMRLLDGLFQPTSDPPVRSVNGVSPRRLPLERPPIPA